VYVYALALAAVGWCLPQSAKAQCVAGNRFGDCTASPQASNCGCDWFDDIESYTAGPMPFSNGWEGWAQAAAAVGEVSTDEDHTTGSGQSLKNNVNNDQVRVFEGGPSHGGTGSAGPDDGFGYDGFVSDAWLFKAWLFVPNGQSGQQFLIVCSRYTGAGAGTAWNMQTNFSGSTGVLEDEITGTTLPLTQNQWKEFEVFVNLRDDQVLVLYDGLFFYSGVWSFGIFGDNDPVTDSFWGAIDLFSNGGTAVYWDDLSIEAAEIPTVNPPSITCKTISRDDNTGCCEYLFRVTNNNLNDPFDDFHVDIEAGLGGGVCQSLVVPGWTCTNCTGTSGGHSNWRCSGGSLDPGDTLTGTLLINPNKVADRVVATGFTIPGSSVQLTAAQGPQFDQVCAFGDYSFGPSTNGAWGGRTFCTCFLTAPALSQWAKAALGVFLIGGGAVLVLRSRRTVIA
jgi:hypothetical protein